MKASIFAALAAAFLLGATPAPPPVCSGAHYHDFDFWVGSWTVHNVKGQKVGHNVITREAGGCALQEHWKGGGGSIGTSLNMWDSTKSQWHQTWVDNSGLLLLINGGLQGRDMKMEGITGTGAQTTLNRIVWTPLADGRVRQHWTTSTDGGKTWTEAFDGYYSKDAQ